MTNSTRIALVGCGYVADFYIGTMPAHPELEIAGIFDCDAGQMARCASFYKLSTYSSLDQILNDPSVPIVVNLTNPGSHYEVTRRCLEAGKHVYSEKPLSIRLSEAEQLVELAERKGLQLSSAPCSVLSETAHTIWKALRQNEIGKVLMVRAELSDGFLAGSRYWAGKSKSGASWPWMDEVTVGCTLEHAGYYLTWLAAFFGRAESVMAISYSSQPEVWMANGVEDPGPDSSIACVRYESGVIAKLTCNVLAPVDRTLTIIGQDGILRTGEAWDYRSPVSIQRRDFLGRVANKLPFVLKLPGGIYKYPLLKGDGADSYRRAHKMDFARGVAELAKAIATGRSCRLSAQFSLHINELALAIHNAGENGSTYYLRTKFEPFDPMPWADFTCEKESVVSEAA